MQAIIYKKTQKAVRGKRLKFKTYKISQHGGSAKKELEEIFKQNPELLKYLGIASIGLAGSFLLWVGYVELSDRFSDMFSSNFNKIKDYRGKIKEALLKKQRQAFFLLASLSYTYLPNIPKIIQSFLKSELVGLIFMNLNTYIDKIRFILQLLGLIRIITHGLLRTTSPLKIKNKSSVSLNSYLYIGNQKNNKKNGNKFPTEDKIPPRPENSDKNNLTILNIA